MKDKKTCHICGKNVYEMGAHISNIHPQILKKLEEQNTNAGLTGQETQATLPNYDIKPPLSQANRVVVVGHNNINDLIREKLDTMLNIKIIQMLSNNPDISINDLQKAINPPQPSQLSEVVALHNLIYKEERELPQIETGNQWLDIAQQAMPMVKELFTKKQEAVINVRGGKETNTGILKPIQLEIAGDTRKPAGTLEKSGAPSDTKQ